MVSLDVVVEVGAVVVVVEGEAVQLMDVSCIVLLDSRGYAHRSFTAFHPRPPRTNGYAQRQNAEPLVETKSEVAPTDTWGAPAVEEVAPASNDDWGTAPVDDWGAVASTTVDDSWGTEVEPPAKPVVSQTTKSEAKEPVKPTPAPLRPGDGSKTSWAQLVKGYGFIK